MSLTPFGLRKKLRSALGMGRPDRQLVTYPVTFVLPDGAERVLQVEEHYSLLMASQALPAPISTGRRAGGTCPDGGCAMCRVEVLSTAGISPMNDAERASLDASIRGEAHEGRPRPPAPPALPTTRLACYAKVVGPGGRVQVHELFDFDSIRGDPTGS